MKFGFHTQMNNSQHQATHTQMLDDIREQVQLCEQLGFDAVWLPEHHLNPEGLGNSPNPILFAADLACRTSRIKIGFACLTTTMWHPIRLRRGHSAIRPSDKRKDRSWVWAWPQTQRYHAFQR